MKRDETFVRHLYSAEEDDASEDIRAETQRPIGMTPNVSKRAFSGYSEGYSTMKIG